MTMARAHLIDVSVTRWYRCVTRFVRRALLLGEAPWNRKVGTNNAFTMSHWSRVGQIKASADKKLTRGETGESNGAENRGGNAEGY